MHQELVMYITYYESFFVHTFLYFCWFKDVPATDVLAIQAP